MNRKMMAPRNPFVAVAKLKKAGAHGKSKKALRRAEKMELQSGYGIAAVQRAFNPQTKVQLLVARPAPSKTHFPSAIRLMLEDQFRSAPGR